MIHSPSFVSIVSCCCPLLGDEISLFDIAEFLRHDLRRLIATGRGADVISTLEFPPSLCFSCTFILTFFPSNPSSYSFTDASMKRLAGYRKHISVNQLSNKLNINSRIIHLYSFYNFFRYKLGQLLPSLTPFNWIWP